MEKSKPKHALQEAIGFSLEDLDINRESQMSETQRRRLGLSRNRWFAFNAVMFAIAILAVRSSGFAESDYNRIGSFILVSIPLGLFFVYSLLKWVQYALDLLRGEIRAIESTIELDLVSKGRAGTGYKLCSDGRCFEVSKPIFLAFKNHEPYLIFYAPYSKTILSAQWLRE